MGDYFLLTVNYEITKMTNEITIKAIENITDALNNVFSNPLLVWYPASTLSPPPKEPIPADDVCRSIVIIRITARII
jgi:hypothetical protein